MIGNKISTLWSLVLLAVIGEVKMTTAQEGSTATQRLEAVIDNLITASVATEQAEKVLVSMAADVEERDLRREPDKIVAEEDEKKRPKNGNGRPGKIPGKNGAKPGKLHNNGNGRPGRPNGRPGRGKSGKGSKGRKSSKGGRDKSGKSANVPLLDDSFPTDSPSLS
eukprot:scaffold3087_cov130-Alexandrium_tamarense.AAC.12